MYENVRTHESMQMGYVHMYMYVCNDVCMYTHVHMHVTCMPEPAIAEQLGFSNMYIHCVHVCTGSVWMRAHTHTHTHTHTASQLDEVHVLWSTQCFDSYI